MSATFSALMPVFLVIVVGAIARRLKPFPDSVWDAVDTLVYWLLLPALLVVKLGATDLSAQDWEPMAAALAGATLIAATATALLRPILRLSPGIYTSVLQGAVRQNSYIGLAAASALYGQDGLTLAAVGIAGVIPLVNVIAVWSLNRHLRDTPPDLTTMVLLMIKNPIIVACAIGIAFNASGLTAPIAMVDGLEMLGGAALPMGLLSVGAGLRFAAIQRGWAAITLANTIKLVAVPLLTLWLCREFDAAPIATAVAVLFASLPSSAASYVFSRQLGGDHELMAAILTTQVVVAAITIPVFVGLLG
ncbi:MAG: AEC family transporter [Rhodospirillaceae bacterium]|nr:AEC family transporter [Rhodospirillaceae bacterium]